ncbi:MAG: isoprenylcysteine carboxylmethyltransferase family protein [Geminicoccaceae bacterium]|nr:MAG: isoprenylcysteine carboxylmethyltransferase family protein [Geminicoccaceae bacterium]
MSALDHGFYALLWLSFGAGHSLLAGQMGQKFLRPWVGRWHRLAYNVIAVVHLAAVLVMGRLWLGSDAVEFERPLALVLLQGAMLILALGLFWAGGRRYDFGRFMGTVPEQPGGSIEPLITDGLHGRIRHPLYAGAHLFLWSLVHDPFSLATALWGSLYLIIGTWFEERRLHRLYGETYADYCRRVPALIPRFRR